MSHSIFDKSRVLYSSIGNDGIIEFIFERLSLEVGTFVEFGAHNGIHGSNTRNLLKKHHWSGLYIESRFTRYFQLLFNTLKYPLALCRHATVSCFSDSPESLDNIVASTNLDHVDFISIDIDGLDFEILESINHLDPLLYCVEGGQMLEPHHDRVSPSISQFNIGQSLSTIANIADSKGYSILGSSQDTFLIRKDKAYLFDSYMTSDLISLYEAGLRHHPRRIPWIQKMVRDVGLENRIINSILKETDYHKYGYSRRSDWFNSTDPGKLLQSISLACESYRKSI